MSHYVPLAMQLESPYSDNISITLSAVLLFFLAKSEQEFLSELSSKGVFINYWESGHFQIAMVATFFILPLYLEQQI